MPFLQYIEQMEIGKEWVSIVAWKIDGEIVLKSLSIYSCQGYSLLINPSIIMKQVREFQDWMELQFDSTTSNNCKNAFFTSSFILKREFTSSSTRTWWKIHWNTFPYILFLHHTLNSYDMMEGGRRIIRKKFFLFFLFSFSFNKGTEGNIFLFIFIFVCLFVAVFRNSIKYSILFHHCECGDVVYSASQKSPPFYFSSFSLSGKENFPLSLPLGML